MEKLPIENWNSSRVRAAEAMIRSMEAHMRLLEKQRDFLSVWKADKVRSLEAHVKELERQRDFLTLWKPDLYSGADIEGSHVDVQLQASDGYSVHAHKAVLVSSCVIPLIQMQCHESKRSEVPKFVLIGSSVPSGHLLTSF